MTTPSAKLGLAIPTGTDPFLTSEIATNWQTIDDSPGTYVSAGLPSWTGAAKIGRKVYDSTTKLTWTYTNRTDSGFSGFERLDGGKGVLLNGSGAKEVTSTADFTAPDANNVTMLTWTGDIPPGARTILVEAKVFRIYARDDAIASLMLYQGGTLLDAFYYYQASGSSTSDSDVHSPIIRSLYSPPLAGEVGKQFFVKLSNRVAGGAGDAVVAPAGATGGTHRLRIIEL